MSNNHKKPYYKDVYRFSFRGNRSLPKKRLNNKGEVVAISKYMVPRAYREWVKTLNPCLELFMEAHDNASR